MLQLYGYLPRIAWTIKIPPALLLLIIALATLTGSSPSSAALAQWTYTAQHSAAQCSSTYLIRSNAEQTYVVLRSVYYHRIAALAALVIPANFTGDWKRSRLNHNYLFALWLFIKVIKQPSLMLRCLLLSAMAIQFLYIFWHIFVLVLYIYI